MRYVYATALLILMVAMAPLYAAKGVPRAAKTLEDSHEVASDNIQRPLLAEMTAAGATVPDGFSVDVIASEPNVGQPVALAWDHRGRLWLAELRTYADRSKNFDLAESDRIVVLEDRDGDGRFETHTVFAENLQRLTSIAIGFGGVWALTPPALVFIPDADGDLVPDGPSVTKLDGFLSLSVRHNIANGLKWGPDGWLYGRHGILGASEIGKPGTPPNDRLRIDTAIWRYHPQTQRVEAWTRGGTNAWGHDWGPEGDLFYINTVIGHLWHGIPGAYTRRMFGQHERPYLYRLIDMHADHWHFDINGSWTNTRKDVDAEDAFGGGHAHAGLMIYQAEKWPVEYHGDVFALNFHGRRINRESLHRVGSGFMARHAPDLVTFPDRWFRGVDLAQGPDGDMYVLDWSDTGECHDHDAVHRNSGRIYRVRYGPLASGPLRPPQTYPELDGWLRHANAWFARQARLMIQEKQAKATLPADWVTGLRARFAAEKDGVLLVRYLHALHAAGAATPAAYLTHPHEAVRVQAIYLLRDQKLALGHWGAALEQAAEQDSSRVRLAISSLLPRLRPREQVSIARRLLKHSNDANDHNYPAMLWYGIEPVVGQARPEIVTELLQACRMPELGRYISRRLAEDYPDNRDLLSRLILAHPDSARELLAGVADALQGLPRAEPLPEWERISGLAPGDARVDQLGALFGDGRSLQGLLAIAEDDSADPSARRQAVGYLADSQLPDLKRHLLRWIDNDQLSGVSARALARFPDERVGQKLLQRFPYMKPAERAATVDVLVSRSSWARMLLDRIGGNSLRPEVLSVAQARQVTQHGDPALTKRLNEVWGEFNPLGKDEEAAALGRLLRQEITADTLRLADLSAGRKIYAERCASCHQLYGEGGRNGPDLTGSGRHQLDYLLENILYPSAVVPAGYRLSNLYLKDGRVLSGVIVARNDRRVTLKTINASQPVYLAPQEIEATETSSLSLMPSGLLEGLDKTQRLDFFGYLMGDHQAPLKDE